MVQFGPAVKCGHITPSPLVPLLPVLAAQSWLGTKLTPPKREGFFLSVWLPVPAHGGISWMENGKGRINAWKRAEELDQPLGFGSWVGMVLSSRCYFLPCWVSSLGLIFSSPHCWFKGVLSHFSSQELFSIPFSFWFARFRGFFSSFNCWCAVEKQRREANGGKLNQEERTNFHILCPDLLRFMQYFQSRRLSFVFLV